MVNNDVSFILSFVILVVKMWIFGFFPGVCPTKPSNLVFSLECLVSNGRQALLGGIRLSGSTTTSFSEGSVTRRERARARKGERRGLEDSKA